jgi:hypothetical protein
MGIILENLRKRFTENDPGTVETITKEAAGDDIELDGPTTPDHISGLA